MAQQIKQPVNEEKLQKLAEMTMGYITGQIVSLMVYMGDKLGLYEPLSQVESATAAELAEVTGLKERWLLEWLRNQATAGLVNYEGDDRYSLSPEMAVILLDTKSPFYMAGMFSAPVTPEELSHAEDGFSTGKGVTWDDHGPEVACMIKRLNTAMHGMLPSVLQRVDGLGDRLAEGIHVVDVGCGAGEALQGLAALYPNSTFEGYDPSPHAIDMARADTNSKQLDNITYHIKRGEDLPKNSHFDLVFTLDCMHDMTRPDKVIKAIRESIKSDGVWMIKDIKCSDKMEENLENPTSPLFYGISILYCMSAALSEPDGAGLGTMGFNPKLAQKMTSEGGFKGFEEIEVEADPLSNYFVVYP